MFGEFLINNIGVIILYSLLAFLVVRIIVSLVTSVNSWKRLKESLGVMIFLLVSLVYVISPVDFIPDILILVGWIDDLLLLFISVGMARSAIVNIIWGDLPREKRFENFLKWYAVIFLITAIIMYQTTSTF